VARELGEGGIVNICSEIGVAMCGHWCFPLINVGQEKYGVEG